MSKEDLGDCQCCCDKDQNSTDADSYGNPACCTPLICDYKCGVSANEPTNNENYGLCSVVSYRFSWYFWSR